MAAVCRTQRRRLSYCNSSSSTSDSNNNNKTIIKISPRSRDLLEKFLVTRFVFLRQYFFIKAERSRECTEKPANRPYSEPGKSRPNIYPLFSYNKLHLDNRLPSPTPIISLFMPTIQVFQLKLCTHFLSLLLCHRSYQFHSRFDSANSIRRTQITRLLIKPVQLSPPIC